MDVMNRIIDLAAVLSEISVPATALDPNAVSSTKDIPTSPPEQSYCTTEVPRAKSDNEASCREKFKQVKHADLSETLTKENRVIQVKENDLW
jgi:hypothetical protein